MIRSMIAHTTLPESLWSKVLKTDVYLLNKVPSKTVTKTTYKLWTEKFFSIRHFHVWGCPAETQPYMPHEKKPDLRTFSCFFVRYSCKLSKITEDKASKRRPHAKREGRVSTQNADLTQMQRQRSFDKHEGRVIYSKRGPQSVLCFDFKMQACEDLRFNNNVSLRAPRSNVKVRSVSNTRPAFCYNRQQSTGSIKTIFYPRNGK